MKLPTFSTILGYLGTILTGVLSTMTDTHALVVPTPVFVLLNASAAVLVMFHVGFGKWLERELAVIEKDLHVTAATAKAATASTQAAKQATDLLSQLHGAVTAPPATPTS